MTQSDEMVSVIVPAYNAALTIGQTLESCLAQTHRALEVIVVDDGSTDDTGKIVQSFAARDPRVRLVRQQNAGVAAARNLAIAHAEGNYVAPLDADDLWHPEKIALQIAAMREGGSRVGVVYCWRRIIDAAGCFRARPWLTYPHEGDVYAALIMENILGCSSVPLIRRACLRAVGGYDPGLRAQHAQGCEDLKLYLQLAERCDFALVPKFLVGYRASSGSMSSRLGQMLRSHKIVLAEARRRHPELPSWLFRLGEARYRYHQGKACLRDGRPLRGAVLLVSAFKRDPAAVVYRSAERPYRAISRWFGKQPPVRPSIDAPKPGMRTSKEIAQTLSRPAMAHPHRPAGGEARPFLDSTPDPVPGASPWSTLYTWRCETAAVGLAGRTRTSEAFSAHGGPLREGDANGL